MIIQNNYDLKKVIIMNKIHCKNYIVGDDIKVFLTNLVSYLCNIKNYDVNKLKSISIRVNEIDNTIHVKIYFEEFISHIPITKYISITNIKNKKMINFVNEENYN